MIGTRTLSVKQRTNVKILVFVVLTNLLYGCAVFSGEIPPKNLPNVPNLQAPTISLTKTVTLTPFLPSTPSAQITIIATPTITSSPTPSWGERLEIGLSVENRPIVAYQYGNGPEARIIIADIHGGYEENTAKVAEELISYITANPSTIPSHVTLFIIPVFNPDGLARAVGPAGRGNANQVDLNRNFPINWEAGYAQPGCWNLRPLSAGGNPFSEPETKALRDFIQQHPVESLISYHSAGLGIFPGAWPNSSAPSKNLAETLSKVSNYPYPPIDTGCKYTGQLIDWADEQGIAAVDVELSDHIHLDLDKNLLVLKAFLDWIKPQ